MDKKALRLFIEERARFHGFSHIGISKAEFMEEEAQRLETWLNQSFHGQMHYLEDHFDKRVDPTKLVPGAKSVISLLYNYFPEAPLETEDNYKIGRYAYGKDYHNFIKRKLRKLIKDIRGKVGDIHGRVFLDAEPVLERDWAKRSGLGWIGKNTMLINKEEGSYFLIAELIVDLELEYDSKLKDYCGTCTRCIDACPTDAISEKGYVLDSSKCISYLTIELRDKIPETFQNKMEDWIFGCDICQEVCPWNKFAKPHIEYRFTPKEELKQMRKKDWEELTHEVFDDVFFGSPLKRAKFEGIKRNISFVKNENGK